MKAALVCLVLAASAAHAELSLTLGATSVPRYGRLDVTVGADPFQGNPFDPTHIEVSLQVTAPSGAVTPLPCFLYQHYERRPVKANADLKDWLYPVGEPEWRARFAPTELGEHTVWAVRAVPGATERSEEVTFDCTASESKGFVRVCEAHPRYLQFSEGQPFLALGQNIAFVKDTYRQEELFKRLAAGGGNYVRVWVCCIDWGLSLQSRKSAYGRSWEWDPPVASAPGSGGFNSERLCLKLSTDGRSSVDVAPSHPIALRPGTRYRLSSHARVTRDAELAVKLGGEALTPAVSGDGKWQPFEYEFTSAEDQWWLGGLSLEVTGEGTAWVDGPSLREAEGGPELLWEADVNRPVLGEMNLYDCFMLDTVVEAAERNGIYLQLVVLPRDPFQELHPSLKRGGKDAPDYDEGIRKARDLLRYCVARWGYSTSVAAWEYFNEVDPEAPLQRFYQELGEYLEAADPYGHPRMTSTWHHSPRDWPHPELDAINLHHYMRPVEGEVWRDGPECLEIQTSKALASEPTKPVLMAEFGLADERWGISPYQKQDAELIHLHNALWASALSGLAGTVMPWWWDELDRMDVHSLYTPLAAFTQGIPFTTENLEPISQLSPEAPLRMVGLRGERCAYLWLCDPQATWGNVVVDGIELSEMTGAVLDLPDMPAGEYAVDWWDTRSGEVTGRSELSHDGGALRLQLPGFTHDVACKVVPTDR